jgi:hypothetical protein
MNLHAFLALRFIAAALVPIGAARGTVFGAP